MANFGFLAIVPILLYLLFFGFIIYSIIRVLRFMDEKAGLEKERNARLQQVAKALELLTKKDNVEKTPPE